MQFNTHADRTRFANTPHEPFIGNKRGRLLEGKATSWSARMPSRRSMCSGEERYI